MGQYYHPLFLNGNKRTFLNPFQYDNGLKLTEHSWMGNRLMNAAFALIKDKPTRVAWVGDYSDEQYGDPYEGKMPYEKFMRYYRACWGPDHDPVFSHPEPLMLDENTEGWYLVNHTQKLSLDLVKYCDQNSLDGWTVNPLSLLTACGNGRGGGDYHSQRPDYDKVGTWAFDRIELTQNPPAGYTPVMYGFKEE